MTDNRSVLLSIEQEITKEYSIFNASGKLATLYVASVDTPNGGKCLKISYEYHETFTSAVVKRKEEVVEWDSSWDM